jgi:transposase InsO family protein
MTWKASDAMSERVKFIGLVRSGQRTFSGLCREFGISRPTGYKWAERFEKEGLDGLKERSRAPECSPQQTSPEVQELVVKARKQHPSWGPRKLKAWLEDQEGTPELPAPSTIGDILCREGLVKRRRLRRKLPLPVGPYTQQVSRPNEEWAADFKGQFRMGCGEYCYPLTISDGFSRYLLEIRALRDTGTEGARGGFERAFRTYGLPMAIRSDNGSPFATTALGRLSSLSIWWLKLGIRPVTIRPSHPQDNGRHERMHRTLKAETTRPPANVSERESVKDVAGLGCKGCPRFISAAAAPPPDLLPATGYGIRTTFRKSPDAASAAPPRSSRASAPRRPSPS